MNKVRIMCLSIAIQHPELILGEGHHLGYEWNIVVGPLAHRCGYVRVPKGHPWHGKDYNDIEVSVHGGLTFAEKDMPCGKGGADDGYWVGFDCAHFRDAPDDKLLDRFGPDKAAGLREARAFMESHVGRNPGTVRSQEYVQAQCLSLIEQAVAVA